MKKALRLAGIFLIPVVLVSTVSTCTGRDTLREPPYANAIVESILTAYNEDDYVQYTRDFNPVMKNAATPEAFDQVTRLLKSKIGDNLSKEFWKTESVGQYLAVFYKARFTAEPEVIIRVLFDESGGKPLVAGLFFDSPKLKVR